jgi:hypothetical protein
VSTANALFAHVNSDKTFFFGSWQSSREGNAAPQIASVPIPSEHQGIFPGRVNDPTAGGAASCDYVVCLHGQGASSQLGGGQTLRPRGGESEKDVPRLES